MLTLESKRKQREHEMLTEMRRLQRERNELVEQQTAAEDSERARAIKEKNLHILGLVDQLRTMRANSKQFAEDLRANIAGRSKEGLRPTKGSGERA